MAELFDPARHEPLGDAAWDAGAARQAIEAIVADIRAEAGEDATWAIHPREDAREGTPPYRNLYLGSAGVTLGLDHLVRIGAVAPGPTFADRLPDHLAANRRMFEALKMQTRSYLMGDAGIRLTEWRTTAAAAAADALAGVVADNADDPARELMWGAPGTMLAARAMHRWTGEARWAELYRRGVEALDRRRVDDAAGGVSWEQDLYGRQMSFLGLAHGFAGVALALIAGRELLDPAAWPRWSAGLARTLEATAVRGEAGVNWAPGAGATQAPMMVQICHGAPGMIYGLAGLDRADRRPLDRRWRGDLAGGAAHQRRQLLPWHRRQRLRLPEALRAERRCAVAGSGAGVRHARHRPERGGGQGGGPPPRHPLDRRHRPGVLPRRLPRRPLPLSQPGVRGLGRRADVLLVARAARDHA